MIEKCLPASDWLIYIILCDDGTLYTGITTDIVRRWNQHKNKTGAKYFRGRCPEKLVYLEPSSCRSSASKRESSLKKLQRRDKLILIKSAENQVTHYNLTVLED